MKFILLDIQTVVTIKRKALVKSKYLVYVNGHLDLLYCYKGNYYVITSETKTTVTLELAYLSVPDQVTLFMPREQYEIGISRYVFNDTIFSVNSDYSLSKIEG